MRNIYWLHQKSCLDGQTLLILSDRTCDGTAICIRKQGHGFRGLGRLVSIPCRSSGMIIQVGASFSQKRYYKEEPSETIGSMIWNFFRGKMSTLKKPSGLLGWKKSTDLMFPLISRLQVKFLLKMWLFWGSLFLQLLKVQLFETQTFGGAEMMAFKPWFFLSRMSFWMVQDWW